VSAVHDQYHGIAGELVKDGGPVRLAAAGTCAQPPQATASVGVLIADYGHDRVSVAAALHAAAIGPEVQQPDLQLIDRDRPRPAVGQHRLGDDVGVLLDPVAGNATVVGVDRAPADHPLRRAMNAASR